VINQLPNGDLVPVEVVTFGWQATERHLAKLGAKPVLRLNSFGQPSRTDGGNYTLDCTFPQGVVAAALAKELDHITGVIEHGFFIGMASEVHVAAADGVRVLSPSGSKASA
ncbi:MAG TPA: ribose-5-phosphate isomerase A, partial [Verrucomicrobiae bacterium]|nr:ribose-5-phosphate isomerase A [Verrucomicrobiae bacterium]